MGLGRGHVKATTEDIVNAYKELGSVWKVAKHLGMCGQSIWERLTRLGYQMHAKTWTDEELIELAILAPQCSIGEIASRLGRPYAGVAGKISRLGLGTRFGNTLRRKKTYRKALTQNESARYLEDLRDFDGPIRQFCTQRGLEIEFLTNNIQRYDKQGWKEFVTTRSKMDGKRCPQCNDDFIPMTAKQTTCSRKCAALRRVDLQYFGGNRSNTVGLADGQCQLCKQHRSFLSSHHVYGRQNDESSELLVALCRGCHQTVGTLAGKSGQDTAEFWETLIGLCMFRRHGNRKPLGFHVTVAIEEMDANDIADEECAA